MRNGEPVSRLAEQLPPRVEQALDEFWIGPIDPCVHGVDGKVLAELGLQVAAAQIVAKGKENGEVFAVAPNPDDLKGLRNERLDYEMPHATSVCAPHRIAALSQRARRR